MKWKSWCLWLDAEWTNPNLAFFFSSFLPTDCIQKIPIKINGKVTWIRKTRNGLSTWPHYKKNHRSWLVAHWRLNGTRNSKNPEQHKTKWRGIINFLLKFWVRIFKKKKLKELALVVLSILWFLIVRFLGFLWPSFNFLNY